MVFILCLNLVYLYYPNLNSRSINIYKLLTKQNNKLSKNNRSLNFIRYFQTLVSTI